MGPLETNGTPAPHPPVFLHVRPRPEYHLEAAIAWLHATAPSTEATEWARIVAVYDRLLELRPSPVVALNRAIALAQVEGPDAGLAAIRGIEGSERLEEYPFLPAALGDLELKAGRAERAAEHFKVALLLARNPTERRFFRQRLDACDEAAGQADPAQLGHSVLPG